MDEVITGFLGEAEAHGNGLGGVVDDLDDRRQGVRASLSDIAMEFLDW